MNSLPFVEELPGGLKINVRILPRASKNEIGEVVEGALRIKLTAPPVEGLANKQLIAFLSKEWKISKSRIEIMAGEKGRHKRIFFQGVALSYLKRYLNNLPT